MVVINYIAIYDVINDVSIL